MFLDAAVSFRGCRAVVELLQPFLPQFRAAPAPSTVESWLLRLGLHELLRPKDKADDWVFIVDHTIQLGKLKCLLIVGIRLSAWEKLTKPLTHQDLTVITLEPVEKSNGEKVYQQLEAASERVGIPSAILSDHGSDVTRGAHGFLGKHPETRVLNDIAHQAAIVLKRELLADPRWDALRVEGYHATAVEDLRRRLEPVVHTAPGQRMAMALLEFIEEQSQAAKPDESLPASSEVLESLIGKGKRM